MNQAVFRFYAELNDFLPANKRQQSFVYEFTGRVAIKDTIESLGIPHTEVGQILVNGEPVDFSYILQLGDECSVYPISLLNNKIQYPSRFVLDVHLGKLAGFLRMLGFDTLYRNDYEDKELAKISSREERILLSRDIGLLKRSLVTYGYFVRETNPHRQLIEVLRRFDLFKAIAPYCRCLHCNGLLEPVAKEMIIDRLPTKTRQKYHEFRQCPSCGQIFWKGTHYERMQAFIATILNEESQNKDLKN